MNGEFDQEGVQRRAAHWLLEGLPGLYTVAFSWEQQWWFYGFEMVVWRVWDRGVLLRLPSPPPPEPESEGELIEREAIPPWQRGRTPINQNND
jgi:hypothetical protein